MLRKLRQKNGFLIKKRVLHIRTMRWCYSMRQHTKNYSLYFLTASNAFFLSNWLSNFLKHEKHAILLSRLSTPIFWNTLNMPFHEARQALKARKTREYVSTPFSRLNKNIASILSCLLGRKFFHVRSVDSREDKVLWIQYFCCFC